MSDHNFLTKVLTDTILSRRSFVKWSAALGGTTALVGGGLKFGLQAVEQAAAETEAVRIPTAACSHNCSARCIANAHVRDGVIIRYTEGLDGPDDLLGNAQLRPCVVGRAYRRRVYHPDRLKYPMKRVGERGEGKFERISWDEALDTAARELKRIADTYGPTAILNTSGSGGHGQLYNSSLSQRVLAFLGGQTTMWGGASNYASKFASDIMYGAGSSGQDANDIENFLYSKLIIMWGWNPSYTIWDGTTPWYLTKAREQGAKIICVDPIYNDSAVAWADEYIPCRPSTDAAMMLALAYVMIEENLYDRDFIEKFTVGFDEFKRYVMGEEDGIPKDPAWASAICGAPATTIAKLAREYAGTKPACLYDGWAIGRTAYGEQAIRAAITLQAMTGNIGVLGGEAAGNHSWSPKVGRIPVPEYEGRKINRPVLWTAVTEGEHVGEPVEIKAVWETFASSLNQIEDTNRGVQALKDMEFILVHEHFMTPTAKFADILLPAATHLERNDILRSDGKGGHYVIFSNKAIDPLYECKTDYEICAAIAERLGFGEEFTEGKSEEDWLRQFHAESEITLPYDEFKRQGYFKIIREPRVAFAAQIQDGEPFPTPSGKIEIYSEILANKEFTEYDPDYPDIPPIPKWIAPWEGLESPLAGTYSLIGYSPHQRWRTHSTHDNVDWLREAAGDFDFIWINPHDAQARGIRDGDKIRVRSERGIILQRAKVTNRIMPGVVGIWQGRWYTPAEPGQVGTVDRRGATSTLNKSERSPAGASCYNTILVEVEAAQPGDELA